MAIVKDLTVLGPSRFLGDGEFANITGTWTGNTINVAHGGTGSTTFTSGALLTGNGTGAIAGYTPAWQAWVAGTSNGPQAKIKLGNVDYTSAAIPAANGTTASGIITTGAQTIGGAKTFSSTINSTVSDNAMLSGVSTEGTWNYIRMKSGTNFWDIATKSTNLSGALEFRPNGASSKGPYIGTDGKLNVKAGGLQVHAGGATVTAGGLTITAGGLTVSADGATITGNSTFNNNLTVKGDTTLGDANTNKVTIKAKKIDFSTTTAVEFDNLQALWGAL